MLSCHSKLELGWVEQAMNTSAKRPLRLACWGGALLALLLGALLLFSAAQTFHYYDLYLRAGHSAAKNMQGNPHSLVLFIGDSRVSGWAENDNFDAAYWGFDGATSHQIATALDAVPGSKHYVLQLGVNDLRLLGIAPERRVAVVSGIVKNLQQLSTRLAAHGKVTILTIMPTGSVSWLRRWVWSTTIEQARQEVNRLITAHHWPENVSVVNLNPALATLGHSAHIDTLHLSSSAYHALNAELDRYLTSGPP